MNEFPVPDAWKTQLAAEKEKVRSLGKAVGFGNMMELARDCWRELLEGEYSHSGGEFAVGPCVAMTEPCGCDHPSECDWCCGCGWLTKHVKAVKDSGGVL